MDESLALMTTLTIDAQEPHPPPVWHFRDTFRYRSLDLTRYSSISTPKINNSDFSAVDLDHGRVCSSSSVQKLDG